MTGSKAFIVSAKRTAIGKFLGGLSAVQPKEMGAAVVKALLEDAKVKPDQVSELIWGKISGGLFCWKPVFLKPCAHTP